MTKKMISTELFFSSFFLDMNRKRHRSPSTDYTSSSSSSEDESRERKHKKHKKERKHKKSKKKSKKHKKSKLGAVGDEWGKYGIIHESDIFSKEAEFQAWLIDIKKADVETLSNVKRKQMFIDFMEDYNTATMPHEKYYNLEKWEQRDRALRMGEPVPASNTEFNIQKDEERLRMEHKRAASMAAASKVPRLQMSRDQLEALTKVNRERVELDRMRKMGLKTKHSLGVRYDEQ
ncbi:uncharacterized protein BX664DRAFT_337896 [Halteromyces radiatus]|uniref:uncharacterized protein n=1 Tax=Halteromyces radiatus TaxID=101107 RepID=UPI00222004D5|nr:uncharacterized protein BX664DRAFT_337896 [Halteromyces radiatus]KAI8084836.1 hypothetical protein BX664DRAFT_337896 [Halteromyces radiatus]